MNKYHLNELQQFQIKTADEQLMEAYCKLSGVIFTLKGMYDFTGKDEALAQLEKAEIELSGYSVAMFAGLDKKWGALFDN